MSTIIKNDNHDYNLNTATPTESFESGTYVRTEGPRNKNLQFVDKLDDYKVHHDDVDIRGFSVKLPTGETVGEVEGLLADVGAKLVRYVEVEVDDDVIERHTSGYFDADDKHFLLPVGLIDINAGTRSVTLYGIGMNHLIDYPRFNRNNGYTTGYEVDTNEYLADFHEYGSTFDRNKFGRAHYTQRDTFDDTFYSSKFYTGRRL